MEKILIGIAVIISLLILIWIFYKRMSENISIEQAMTPFKENEPSISNQIQNTFETEVIKFLHFMSRWDGGMKATALIMAVSIRNKFLEDEIDLFDLKSAVKKLGGITQSTAFFGSLVKKKHKEEDNLLSLGFIIWEKTFASLLISKPYYLDTIWEKLHNVEKKYLGSVKKALEDQELMEIGELYGKFSEQEINLINKQKEVFKVEINMMDYYLSPYY